MHPFNSVSTSKYISTKISEISQRLYEQSIQYRKLLKGKELNSEAPETMLGKEAIDQGYADKVGSYYDVLRTQYPDCDIKHIRIKDKWSTRTLELLVASPIILVLFMIKVLIKYSIIMYLWVRHKKNAEKNAK